MASTFFGLHIGSSALSSFQVATNTTANNIANVKTTGYTRQEATLQAKDAINVTARYGSVGTGVTVTSIKQQCDLTLEILQIITVSHLKESFQASPCGSSCRGKLHLSIFPVYLVHIIVVCLIVFRL